MRAGNQGGGGEAQQAVEGGCGLLRILSGQKQAQRGQGRGTVRMAPGAKRVEQQVLMFARTFFDM